MRTVTFQVKESLFQMKPIFSISVLLPAMTALGLIKEEGTSFISLRMTSHVVSSIAPRNMSDVRPTSFHGVFSTISGRIYIMRQAL